MPEEYYFNETDRVRCVKVKLPVVMAEEDVQVTIDNTTCLPELSQKIEGIDCRVRDVEIEPLFIHERPSRDDLDFYDNSCYCIERPRRDRAVKVKRVTIHGTLHKQILYVDKDNNVKNFNEDIPFTKTVDLPEKLLVLEEDEVYAIFRRASIDIRWDHVRASRVHQTAVINLTIKVIEDRQIYVQVCPSPDERCPRINLVKDPRFEAWSDSLVPIFWGGSNISRTTEAHDGQYAVEIGLAAPTATGSVFQTISHNIHKGEQYKLTFYARENLGAGAAAFTLVADVVFYDVNGHEITSSTNSFGPNDIPDGSYKQLSVNTEKVPEEARTALIRFTFNPAAGNTSAVKIDDVVFMCQS